MNNMTVLSFFRHPFLITPISYVTHPAGEVKSSDFSANCANCSLLALLCHNVLYNTRTRPNSLFLNSDSF